MPDRSTLRRGGFDLKETGCSFDEQRRSSRLDDELVVARARIELARKQEVCAITDDDFRGREDIELAEHVAADHLAVLVGEGDVKMVATGGRERADERDDL